MASRLQILHAAFIIHIFYSQNIVLVDIDNGS